MYPSFLELISHFWFCSRRVITPIVVRKCILPFIVWSVGPNCISTMLNVGFAYPKNFVHSSLPSEGCNPGMYRATNGTCLFCPANSYSTRPELSVCPCFAGYYRAAGDPPEMGCTRKSCTGVCLQETSNISLFITSCLYLNLSIVFSLTIYAF